MVKKRMCLVLLFIVLGFVISGCGPSQSEPGVNTPTLQPTDPAITPLADGGETEESPPETETPQPDPGYSAFWSEAQDDRTGIRFAVPCFWEVQFPTLDPSGLGAFFVRNYDEEFVLAHPRGIVLGTGAIKIDFIYIQVASTDAPSGASLREVAESLGDASTEILSSEIVEINGQEALRFSSQGTFDESPQQTYLFKLDSDLYLLFGVYPGEEVLNPDVQGILHSIALTEEISVQIPDTLPGPAPEGISAPCMKGVQRPSSSETLPGQLACEGVIVDSALNLACQVQDALLARDIDRIGSLMRDPFVIGYWQSEGVTREASAAAAEMDQSRLSANTSGMTFTTDRSLFPPLFGMPPDNMFGPEVDVVLIVYSEGWGEQDLGAALLYFTRSESGIYEWFGIVVDGTHFDK